MLGLFFNPLTADNNYSILNRDNLYNIFRYNYIRNEKYFLDFFLHFLSLDSTLNSSKKKMTLIADVFLHLRTPKKVVR